MFVLPGAIIEFAASLNNIPKLDSIYSLYHLQLKWLDVIMSSMLTVSSLLIPSFMMMAFIKEVVSKDEIKFLDTR